MNDKKLTSKLLNAYGRAMRAKEQKYRTLAARDQAAHEARLEYNAATADANTALFELEAALRGNAK